METPNPFKQLEPDVYCPPHIKTELVSEIDMIRNAVTVVDLYIGDLFGLASALISPPNVTFDNTTK